MSQAAQSTEEVLSTLARLTAADRQWILAQLSETARARLLAGAGPLERAERAAPGEEITSRGAPAPALQAEVPLERLASMPAARIVAALQEEPAWIIHSVLCAREWRWRKAVLKQLPPMLRAEVAHLARAGAGLAPAAQAVLLRALLARLGPPAEPASAFQELLGRITGRGFS